MGDGVIDILLSRAIKEEKDPKVREGLQKAKDIVDTAGYFNLQDLLDEEEDEDVEGATDVRNLKPVTNWRDLKINTQLLFITDDFDGHTEKACTVTDMYADHAIATENVAKNYDRYWIDDDMQEMFFYNPDQNV